MNNRLEVSESDALTISASDIWNIGTLCNNGNIEGEGVIGLNWSDAIEGSAAESVLVTIEEINIPSLDVIVTPFQTSIRVKVNDIGADIYETGIDGGTSKILDEDNLEYRFRELSPGIEYNVWVVASNSRGNAIEANFDAIALDSETAFYKIVSQVFNQPMPTRGQNCVFLARITDIESGEPIDTGLIRSIYVSAYRLIKNTVGIGRVTIEHFENVEVDPDAVSDSLKNGNAWTRDSIGYNFFHSPIQIEQYLFADPGSYQVEYEIRLNEGNPIKLCYDVYVY